MSYANAPFTPTRFPGGLTNANQGENLGHMGQLDPTKFQTFFEDFIAAPSALGVSTGIAGAGGLATVATTVTIATPTASFAIDPTKRFFFKARASLATVANTLTVGFGNALVSATSGVQVSIVGNELTLASFGGDAQSVTVTVATVDATAYEVGFEYTPGKGVAAYLNGGVVARINPASFATANMIAGIRPSGATATVDYIFAAVER